MKAILLSLFAFLSISNASEINSEPINISGNMMHEEQLSSAQKMKILRKRLEKQNERMVRQQIEKLRYKQELQLMKRVQANMNKAMQELN